MVFERLVGVSKGAAGGGDGDREDQCGGGAGLVLARPASRVGLFVYTSE